MSANSYEPGLYLVATPIGNLGDISNRAIEFLGVSDIVACEDTRESKKLFQLLGIDYKDKEFVSLHEHNEFKDSQKILEKIAQGNIVAYCSDAGMPVISDPGAQLVNQAHLKGINVSCIPGPSSATTAFALSGFISASFTFYGFLPKTKKAKRDMLISLKTNEFPIVFYESPNRLVATLNEISQVVPNRNVLVARELTKKFENIDRGTAEELLNKYANSVKGEVVVVVDKSDDDQKSLTGMDEINEAIGLMKGKGLSSKDVIEILNPITEISKNQLKEMYQQNDGIKK